MQKSEKKRIRPRAGGYGEEIKALREHLEISQERLARELHVSVSVLAKWEQNRWEPKGRNWAALARAAQGTPLEKAFLERARAVGLGVEAEHSAVDVLEKLRRDVALIMGRLVALEQYCGFRPALGPQPIEHEEEHASSPEEGGLHKRMKKLETERRQDRAELNRLHNERAYREGTTPKGTKRLPRPIGGAKLAFGGGGSL